MTCLAATGGLERTNAAPGLAAVSSNEKKSGNEC